MTILNRIEHDIIHGNYYLKLFSKNTKNAFPLRTSIFKLKIEYFEFKFHFIVFPL